MRKIWAIAWKNVYLTFRDRNTLLVMIATPLVLSLIIGLAFGGNGGGITIKDISVALVNLDTGATQNGQAVNYGQIFTRVLLPQTSSDTPVSANTVTCQSASASGDNAAASSLDELLNVTAVSTVEEAKQGVDSGTFSTAIIIPADFTQRLTPRTSVTDTTTASQPTFAGATLEIYGSGASPISSSVVKSVTESIANQIVTGNIAVAATINTLIERAQTNPAFGVSFLALSATGNYQPDFSCAFTPTNNLLTIQPEALNPVQQQSTFVAILITIGIAQAVFFGLFTAEFGFLNIYEERKAGTLPRLVVAPISRRDILAGYILGVFVTVLFQLTLLMLSLTLIASLLEGKAQFIWGSNLWLLAIVIIAMSIAVCGVGLLIICIARSPQQAQAIGSIVNVFLAFLGGTFGVSVPVQFAVFSPIYWSKEALYRLSTHNTDIGLHVLVLVGIGGFLFAFGVWLFNKREVI